ncbi:hypothetical protein [Streptomyces sp. NPDC002104]
MANEDDFIPVVGKIPKRDKAGNDITGDNLSAGGLRRADGTMSAMAYDLKVQGDDDGRDWLKDLATKVAVEVAAEVTARVAPRVENWWQEKALSRLKRTWAKGEKPARPATLEDHGGSAAAQLATPDAALEDHRTAMTGEEAQRRFKEMLEALAVCVEQVKILSNARVENGADFPGLESAVGKLATPEFRDALSRMLETNGPRAAEETAAGLARIFTDVRAASSGPGTPAFPELIAAPGNDEEPGRGNTFWPGPLGL